MSKAIKSAIVGILTLAVVATSASTPASARKNNTGAIIAGVVVGGLIAGAVISSQSRPVQAAPSCEDYRRRAINDERAGRPGKAQYWWDSYAACRNY